MSYQLQTTAQVYGDNNFLTHKLPGNTADDDRYLFGQRVQSFGIINFGAIASNSSKQVLLSSIGISSPILLRSVYAFNYSGGSDEMRMRLFSGTQKLAEMKFKFSEVPYRFPDGAIIDPSLSIEVEPRYAVIQLLLYWQPVHVLSYIEV